MSREHLKTGLPYYIIHIDTGNITTDSNTLGLYIEHSIHVGYIDGKIP